MSSTSTSVKSQYHHFIPRFILRNFAHPFVPPNGPSNTSAKSSKRQSKGGCHRGEPMLHAIDLSKDTVEIIETPVARTFGLTDMYRNFADATNQHYLEQKFSQLESNAGAIVSKVRKAFGAGHQDVWITRPERDVLRTFLFIMKYRGLRAHKRFYHQTADDYAENDREKLLEYMRKKGYQRPIDVWFDSIKAMLDLKIDTEG
jgi:Protein of unknown function (DUF4238)